jgi:hypothetical protein
VAVIAVAFAGLVLALVLAASFVVPVAVPAPLRAVDAREGRARHRGDHERDREEKEGLAESSGDHVRLSVFHNGANPATPTEPLACASATSERTSSYWARVRLRRAWLSADCDSSRSVVVAVPALSAASVTR